MGRGAEESAGDPRVYFAAERTLLAWVRTGLAMMGFGFVVARFGLFLREMAAAAGTAPSRQVRFSFWIGVMLITLGVAANIGASIKHWHTVRRIEMNLPLHFRPLSLGLVTALLLAAIGILVAAYLFFGFDPL